MWQCNHCKELFDTNVSQNANHSRWCKSNPSSKRKTRKTLDCTKCGIKFQLVNINDQKKTCQWECANKHTTDTKTLMSIKRKKYLNENPDKHVWKRSTKFKSVPSENLKSYLRSLDIEFVEEYNPLADRFFSIDIAFPNLMIGIEINGNQHYNKDGTLSSYYQERNDLITQAGWRIIEVHYTRCFSNDSMSKIIDFDVPIDSNLEILRIKDILSSIEQKKKEYKPLERGAKILIKTDAKWEPLKNKIFNHDIDFMKFGWVTKVAKILGIPPQKVNKWMKKYQPNFYEKECFKRGS